MGIRWILLSLPSFLLSIMLIAFLLLLILGPGYELVGSNDRSNQFVTQSSFLLFSTAEYVHPNDYENDNDDDNYDMADDDDYSSVTSENIQSDLVSSTATSLNQETSSSSSNSQTTQKFGLVYSSDETFHYEIAALILIVIYLLNYLWGSYCNNQIAEKWFSQFYPVFQHQFAGMGNYDADAESVGAIYSTNNLTTPPNPTNPPLLKDSSSCFQLHASGRRNMVECLFTLDLIKRHDLFSLILSLFGFSTVSDTLCIDIVLPDEYEPIILCLCKKKLEKKVKKNIYDLDTYTSISKSTNVPVTLSLLTDTNNEIIFENIVDDNVLKIVSSNIQVFHYFHSTDQAINSSASIVFPKDKKLFRMKLTLNTEETAQVISIITLIKLCFNLVDKLATIKLSSTNKIKSLELRRNVELKEKKEEEKKKKEKENEKDQVQGQEKKGNEKKGKQKGK